MYYSLRIPDKNGVFHWFPFSFGEGRDSRRYEIEDVCIIDVYKLHDHRYDLKAFFYKKKYITYQENIRSKKRNGAHTHNVNTSQMGRTTVSVNSISYFP